MSTFIIRNKETLEQWVAMSGKRAWNKPTDAKNAFANSKYKNKRDPNLASYCKSLGKYESLKFKDQCVYEIIELYSDTESRSAEIERKFKEIVDTLYGNNLGVTGWHLNGQVEKMDTFFEENDWFLPK